jgi:hypothetical protein
MFRAWMEFAFDAARLAGETQQVMGLRLMKLAVGGAAGRREAERMVAEKGLALGEAVRTLGTGGSMHKVMRRYLSRVRANKRRLSR